MLELRPYQREALDRLYAYWDRDGGSPLIVLPTGCHAPGTNILMHDGATKPVELVAVNDHVMGPDSKPRRVLRTIKGREPMYRITPVKGEAFVVNENHILSLKTTNEGKPYPSSVSAGAIENISVKEYCVKSKSWKHLRKLWRTGVEFHVPANDNLPVPPYIVGAMLGDGTLLRSPCLTNMDSEVLDEVCDYAESLGTRSRIVKKPSNQAWQVYFADDESGRSRQNKFAAALERAGLWGMVCDEKRIPHPYKTGSKNTRLEVLAGVLDTDGHLSNGTHFDFISKSEGLSRDVVFVARSLGLAAYVTSCEKFCQTGGGGTYWRVSISGDTNIIPNRVERQKARPRKQIKNPLVTGFSIEPVGVGDFYGFELDSDHLYLTEDFTVHHNSGKSLVIATLMQELLRDYPDMRILNVTHVRELLTQNYRELIGIWPFAPAGLYSAGLGQADANAQIIFGGVQTIANKTNRIGHIDLVLVDEAHLVPRKAETQYGKLFAGLRAINPEMRIAGLTATPFRLGEGMLTDGDGAMFDAIAYEKPVGELIDEGYLCRPVSKGMATGYNLDGVGKVGGDYNQGKLQAAVNRADVTSAAVTEMLAYGRDRRSWLVFCAGVQHAYDMRDELRSRGIACEAVAGETPTAERDRILADFKAGNLRAVTNNSVLTTGFNHPGVDLLALCRPTLSVALYVQMIGRGLRNAPDKTNCLVLDFAGCVRKHGPIDAVRVKEPGKGEGEAPVKQCPQESGGCGSLVHASAKQCPDCGYEFPPSEEPKHAASADITPILSTAPPVWHRVTGRHFREHPPKPGKPPSVKVTYRLGLQTQNEWLCPQHEGYARAKADRYWRTHGGGLPFPRTVTEWLDRAGELAVTTEIQLKPAGKYQDVIGWRAAQAEQVNDDSTTNKEMA